MSSDKSKKAGRNSNKPSHKDYKADHRNLRNKLRRELKNLRTMPNDRDCFNRLTSYLSGDWLWMVGGTDSVQKAIDNNKKLRKVQLAA